MKKGLLVVISSPSGGGKDSVINELLELIPDSTRLVSTTSRRPRPGNEEGVDYHFVSKEDFEKKIRDGELIEYNEYVGNYYGAEKNKLKETLKQYNVVLSQIDVHGKHSLDKFNIKHLSIFLLPDSLDILAERIRKRGGIFEKELEKRLETARQEIEDSKDYDYRIVNKDGKIDETVAKIREIIKNKQKS